MAQQRGIFPGFTPSYLLRATKRWARSGITFGAAGFLAITFFTDWKDLLIHVPVLRQRFIDEEKK